MRRSIVVLSLLLLCCASGWSQIGATLFQQGSTRLSLNAGYGSFNDKDYFILGGGAGYYLFNGLEAGLDGDAWIGSKPHIYELSPRLTYVLYQGEQFKPYIGGFYRHTFFDTLKDLDSAGGRAGLVTPLSEHAYLTAGVVYEGFFHCDSNIYGKCSQVYPELGIAISL